MGLRINTFDVWRFLTPILTADPTHPLMVSRLIQSVIEIIGGKEESEIIKTLSKNVDKLIKVHMEAGKDHLKNALAADDEHDRTRWLNEALNEFIRAKAVEAPPENIKAMIFVATCFSCLGKTSLALNWYEDSYQAATYRHKELAAKRTMGQYPVIIDFLEIWTEITNSLYSCYLETFEVEKTINVLRNIIKPAGQNCSLDFLFNHEAVEVQKWGVLLRSHPSVLLGPNNGKPVLFAFNDIGEIVQAFDLRRAEAVYENDIRGIFRNDGKQFTRGWKLYT